MTRRSFPKLGVLGVLLTGAAGSIFVLKGCAPAGTPATNVTAPVLPTPQGDGAGEDPFANEKRYPELAFQEHSEGLPSAGTWIGYPLLVDFTGDGRADLVASNREEDGYNAWEAAEKGPWIRRIEGLPRDMQYGPARAADVNGDGKPDLLVSAHSDALRVYLNDGHMNWSPGPSKIENPFLMLDIAPGNIDGDKNVDIVGLAHFKGGFGVYLGDGQGGFRRLPESATILHTPSPNSAFFGHDIQLVDIDGDGLDDIVAATNQGAKVYLTRKGTPMKWEEISNGLPAPKIGNSLYSVTPGHFTGGKQFELAVCGVADPGMPVDKRDTAGVYAWNAEKRVWEHIDKGLARGENYRDLRAADLNGDGKLDLIAMTLESGCLIYLGDGKGGFTPKGRLPGLHGKGRIALGDIDADGRIDVAVTVPADKAHPESGGVRAFLNRPEAWK
jgi:hypothetical protein